MVAVAVDGSGLRPASWATSCPASTWVRADSSIELTLSLPPLHVGRSSSRTSRARQMISNGLWREWLVTYSIRSRRVGSAQCRSSMISTAGRRPANTSRKRHSPQKVLSRASPPGSVKPTSWAIWVVICSAWSWPPTSAASRERATSGGSLPLIPAAWRMATAIGQKVMPLPYDRQLPRRTAASPATVLANSEARRDLPIPSGPSTLTRWQVRSRRVRS